MTLDIEVSNTDTTCVVKVAGEVDLYNSPELRAAITKAAGASASALAVDLRGVPYMDSSGVATLVEGLRASAKKNMTFILVSPSNPVMKVLKLSRLDSVFQIQDNL